MEKQWIKFSPKDRKKKSLQWLLISGHDGVMGIRLAVSEDGGWRIVDEFGKSTWVPGTINILGVTPLLVPTDFSMEAVERVEKGAR